MLRKGRGNFKSRQTDSDILIFYLQIFFLILSDNGNDIFQQIEIEAVKI